eukprot:FN607189.1.p1 GENE.FN607189.1~~FN607189.1.p1  ORF type:complete len:74 (+),score=8.53 FN607189.1:24-245(+)
MPLELDAADETEVTERFGCGGYRPRPCPNVCVSRKEADKQCRNPCYRHCYVQRCRRRRPYYLYRCTERHNHKD